MVLNEDGTEVDEDVLEHFSSETLVILRSHQEWSDPALPDPCLQAETDQKTVPNPVSVARKVTHFVPDEEESKQAGTAAEVVDWSEPEAEVVDFSEPEAEVNLSDTCPKAAVVDKKSGLNKSTASQSR